MPQDLLDRLKAAENFDQGFSTVEYTASAIVDLDFHTDASGDPMAAQAATLERLGMPAAITMRHATPHFQHVFSGDGYSSGYYSYMWSEVMDEDAFAAFKETGDAFDPDVAARLAEHIYTFAEGRGFAERSRVGLRGWWCAGTAHPTGFSDLALAVFQGTILTAGRCSTDKCFGRPCIRS
jgi:peptidyl-dipeptidase Dcp